MTLHELLNENIVGVERLGDYQIKIDSHAWQRHPEREVSYTETLDTLKKLPGAKAKFKQLENGQAFWLYDNAKNLALGIRLIKKEQKQFKLKTVWPGMPTDGRYPVFNVA